MLRFPRLLSSRMKSVSARAACRVQPTGPTSARPGSPPTTLSTLMMSAPHVRQRDTGGRHVGPRRQLDNPDATEHTWHLPILFGVFSILGIIDTIDFCQSVLQ